MANADSMMLVLSNAFLVDVSVMAFSLEEQEGSANDIYDPLHYIYALSLTLGKSGVGVPPVVGIAAFPSTVTIPQVK
jgi:hypothetical protein